MEYTILIPSLLNLNKNFFVEFISCYGKLCLEFFKFLKIIWLKFKYTMIINCYRTVQNTCNKQNKHKTQGKHFLINLNPIQDGGRGKKAPYQFFLLTSAKVEISPQNVLTFSFNPFATLV